MLPGFDPPTYLLTLRFRRSPFHTRLRHLQQSLPLWQQRIVKPFVPAPDLPQNPAQNGKWVFQHLALPDHNHLPTSFTQLPLIPPIPFDMTSDLLAVDYISIILNRSIAIGQEVHLV